MGSADGIDVVELLNQITIFSSGFDIVVLQFWSIRCIDLLQDNKITLLKFPN